MARTSGRNLQLKDNAGTVVAVVNSKTINYNNPPVDVTGDDDDGFITYLSTPGTRQITFECSGFTNDDALRLIAASGSGLLAAYTVEYLNDAGTATHTITGNWYLDPFSETGNSDGGLEFSATFATSGSFSMATA